jgi:hypothetical protein
MSRIACVKSFVAVVANLALTSSYALAHPGHAVEITSTDSPVHYLVQPEHALPVVVIMAGAWWVVSALSRKLSLRSI